MGEDKDVTIERFFYLGILPVTTSEIEEFFLLHSRHPITSYTSEIRDNEPIIKRNTNATIDIDTRTFDMDTMLIRDDIRNVIIS